MAAVAPTPITALPTPPSTTDPTNFDARADAFVGALPVMTTETNATATNVYNNAVEAYNQAVASGNQAAIATAQANLAAISAASAASASGAAAWNAATNYTVGICVYSPSNYQTYRSVTGGVHATDPAIDPVNWAPMVAQGLMLHTDANLAASVPVNTHTECTNAGDVTATIAPGASGDTVWITFTNTSYVNVIAASGGQTIMLDSAPMIVDALQQTVKLRYISGDWKKL